MLHKLQKIITKSSKRVGRGFGTGKGGHTVGRGQKGHTSRQGGNIPLWFEGGQLPLIKRLPYWRGKSHFKSLTGEVLSLDVSTIDRLTGQDVTPETLAAAGIIKTPHVTVKFVGKSESLKPVKEVRGIALSSGARASIEKAGGTIVQ